MSKPEAEAREFMCLEPRPNGEYTVDELTEIFYLQKKSQEYRGYNFPMPIGPKRAEYIRSQTLHCIDELCEMLHEVKGYKEWKKEDYSNTLSDIAQQARAREELADALHFFVNIALALNMTAEDLFNAYVKKQKINYERLEDTAHYKKDVE